MQYSLGVINPMGEKLIMIFETHLLGRGQHYTVEDGSHIVGIGPLPILEKFKDKIGKNVQNSCFMEQNLIFVLTMVPKRVVITITRLGLFYDAYNLFFMLKES